MIHGDEINKSNQIRQTELPKLDIISIFMIAEPPKLIQNLHHILNTEHS
jgi:hypothetical protein